MSRLSLGAETNLHAYISGSERFSNEYTNLVRSYQVDRKAGLFIFTNATKAFRALCHRASFFYTCDHPLKVSAEMYFTDAVLKNVGCYMANTMLDENPLLTPVHLVLTLPTTTEPLSTMLRHHTSHNFSAHWVFKDELNLVHTPTNITVELCDKKDCYTYTHHWRAKHDNTSVIPSDRCYTSLERAEAERNVLLKESRTDSCSNIKRGKMSPYHYSMLLQMENSRDEQAGLAGNSSLRLPQQNPQ